MSSARSRRHREVGQDEVDPEHLRGREHQPGVDDDDPPVVLDDGHVLADLAEPAERQDPTLVPLKPLARSLRRAGRALEGAPDRSRSSSEAGTIGSRMCGADRRRSISSAVLTGIGFAVTVIAS